MQGEASSLSRFCAWVMILRTMPLRRHCVWIE